MHYTSYVFILLQIIILSDFQWAALSAVHEKPNRASDTNRFSKAKRSVVGAQPQIQGSVAGTPSGLNHAQQNVISTDKGQPLGQSLTPFEQATRQATTAVASQTALQPSTLAVKPQPAGQITNAIPQKAGQTPALTEQPAGPGIPGAEDLEDDPAVEQVADDELDCDDPDSDPEFLAACRRRRRRHRRRRFRDRQPPYRVRGHRPRRPLDDDYIDRERERLNDWLDFKGSPDYFGDNSQGGTGGMGGQGGTQGGIGGQGGTEGGIGGQGGIGGEGGMGSQGGIGGGVGGGTGGIGGGMGGIGGGMGGTGGGTGGTGGGTGGTGGGMGGTGGGGGGTGGGGGGGGRAEGTDCCCVQWGGLKPHIEWVNVPVCYHPSAICQPHCEHCCDIDCHHCACEPCCGGGCGHHCGHHCCDHCCQHCPCCHCCHHCCHCRRETVANKPPLAPRKNRKKSTKRTESKRTKRKKYHKRHCFCVTPLVMRMPFFPRLW